MVVGIYIMNNVIRTMIFTNSNLNREKPLKLSKPDAPASRRSRRPKRGFRRLRYEEPLSRMEEAISLGNPSFTDQLPTSCSSDSASAFESFLTSGKDRLMSIENFKEDLPEYLINYANCLEGSRADKVLFTLDWIHDDYIKNAAGFQHCNTVQFLFPFSFQKERVLWEIVPSSNARRRQYVKQYEGYWLALLSVSTTTNSFDLIAQKFYECIKDNLFIKWNKPLHILAKLKFDIQFNCLTWQESLTMLNDLLSPQPPSSVIDGFQFNLISSEIPDSRWQFRAIQTEWFSLSSESNELHDQLYALSLRVGQCFVSNDRNKLLSQLSCQQVLIDRENENTLKTLKFLASKEVGYVDNHLLSIPERERVYVTVKTIRSYANPNRFKLIVHEHKMLSTQKLDYWSSFAHARLPYKTVDINQEVYRSPKLPNRRQPQILRRLLEWNIPPQE